MPKYFAEMVQAPLTGFFDKVRMLRRQANAKSLVLRGEDRQARSNRFFSLGGITLTKALLLLFSIPILAACASGARQIVQIEGISHSVFQMAGSTSSYRAHKADLSGGLLDPDDYRLNVLAIEVVAGCPVDVRTINNQGMQTIAAVTC